MIVLIITDKFESFEIDADDIFIAIQMFTLLMPNDRIVAVCDKYFFSVVDNDFNNEE